MEGMEWRNGKQKRTFTQPDGLDGNGSVAAMPNGTELNTECQSREEKWESGFQVVSVASGAASTTHSCCWERAQSWVPTREDFWKEEQLLPV